MSDEQEPTSRLERFDKWANDNPLLFALISTGVILFVLMVAVPEIFPDWVGIRAVEKSDDKTLDKTLWDWLDLVTVSAVIALGLFWLRQREDTRDEERKELEEKRNEEQRKEEQKRQIDNQHQTRLENYFKQMSELLLDKGLGEEEKAVEEKTILEATPTEYETSEPILSKKSDKPRIVARALTLSVLRSLDSKRNGTVLRFLGDADLLKQGILQTNDAHGIDFSEADLVYAPLQVANLERANLYEANLYEANLERANLQGANLREADLRKADLEGANLYRANLQGANLYKAKLQRANLLMANLYEAYLYEANLYEANLERANLRFADLEGAKLQGAKLEGAKLEGAYLLRANLSGAWYNANTRWPAGFDPRERGAIQIDNK